MPTLQNALGLGRLDLAARARSALQSLVRSEPGQPDRGPRIMRRGLERC
ncbi:hypothetical protein H7K38_05515 [Mycobacterium alsense]|uniref:Uncharacterized protein n=1 Tax=Mycobacterium alsense TaxID=324058 RepID=A0AA41XL35_9MYCO|nr:hypothetical protein [Mycobacterium alsense]MCV7378111.1 hypothetical protein [Mycobacterium alsense]